MCYPYLTRINFLYGGQQIIPIGMIRQNQGKFYTALFGTLAYLHPARGEYQQRVCQPPCPACMHRRRRSKDNRPLQFFGRLAALGYAGRAQLAQLYPVCLIEIAQILHRPMQIDRPIIARRPQKAYHPLCLAKGICPYQDRAFRKQPRYL